MRSQSLVSLAILGVAFFACGGTTLSATSARDPERTSGSPPDSGPSILDGGSRATCSVSRVSGNFACVPGIGAPNTPIEIEVGSSTGCSACSATQEPCSTKVLGDVISVSMMARTCEPGGVCDANCIRPRQKCVLPPLAEGSYTLNVDEGFPNGRSAATLVIANDPRSAVSCALPPGFSTPPNLEGSYNTSCSVDADCALVTVGDICSACNCANSVIAKSDQAIYDADLRALRSQCEPRVGGEPPCAACPALKSVCDTSIGLTGKCTLRP
jgi:hypothetical protein